MTLLGSPFPIEPLRLARGHGSWLWDHEGTRYFDGSSGSICVNIGHAHPHVVDAITRQASLAAFAPAGTWKPELLEELARRVARTAGRADDAVMFSTTGSAANELAIRLARQIHVGRGEPRRAAILTASLGFHGCTALTLGLSGHPRRRPSASEALGLAPSFAPPYPGHHIRDGSHRCSAACAEEVGIAIDRLGADDVAAVIFEPVNGASGGGCTPPPGYLGALVEECHRRGVLVVFDEVMVGLGRTGHRMAADAFDAHADLTSVSKGLGAGYTTIAAVLVSPEHLEALEASNRPLPLESTMTGAPLSAATALAVLDVLDELGVASLVTRGAAFEQLVRSSFGCSSTVSDIRGIGFFLALELAPRTLQDVLVRLRAAGVIVYPFMQDLEGEHAGFFIAPPLTSTDAELTELVDRLRHALAAVG